MTGMDGTQLSDVLQDEFDNLVLSLAVHIDVALQEELLALSAAHTADGFGISCHYSLPPYIRRDDASEDGIRCGGWGSHP